jgi:hypothetical protein
MIFHYSTIFSSSKHQNKAEFKNLYGSEVLSSDFPGLKTSAASMASTASTTFTASFHPKNTAPDSWIPLWQPNHQYWSIFVEWIIKTPIFK